MAALTSESGTVILITPTTRRRSSAWHWLGLVASWAVMVGFGAILAVSLVIPKIAGATPYVIETGSMRPSLPPGTMVVAKQVPVSSIQAGDVVTYQLKSGESTVVTHRVVSIGYDGLGNVRFRTQGDTNNAPDKNWVLPEQIRGEKWYAVPYLGRLAFFLQGDNRGLVVGLIILGLIGYALRMFQQSWAERRQGGDES